MTEEFKRDVQEYVDLDTKIKEATKALKVLRDKKKSLSLNINSYMKSNEIDELKLNDCKLKTYNSTSTESLTQALILRRLVLLWQGDEARAKEWCDFICDKSARTKKTRSSLRRIQNKKKKSDN